VFRLLSKNIKIKIYRLPVVLYRCTTWSLTLRMEHRHIAFRNKVCKKTFGSKRDKALCSVLLFKYYSDDQNIRIRGPGHVAQMEDKSKQVYMVLVVRPK